MALRQGVVMAAGYRSWFVGECPNERDLRDREAYQFGKFFPHRRQVSPKTSRVSYCLLELDLCPQ
jgi:hypothetical protein